MFYPADWRKDPELRVCSIAARGLWIDMMALMHEGDPYGHLVVNGASLSVEQLARLVGEPVKLVSKLLAELASRNVFSRNDTGVIFSRRMVADEHIREVRAASGKLGGNPNLLHKPGVNEVVKQTDKQKPTPSVAVAVAPSGTDAPPAGPATIRRTVKPPSADRPDPFPKPLCDAAYERFIERIGAVDYGRFRKAFLPIYRSQSEHPALDVFYCAIEAFAEARESAGAQWMGQYTVEKMAQSFHAYARLGSMPLMNEWGEPTERGIAAKILG